MFTCRSLAVLVILAIPLRPALAAAEDDPPRVELFEYLTGEASATMVSYTPLGLDPRYEPNNESHPTSSIRADLTALRPAFDGLVLYGYHHASTPRILAMAKELKFRAVLLGIWQPKSANEIDGVAELVHQFKDDLALGIVIGNEGITFKRYDTDDLTFAANRLRKRIPQDIPLTTSEPLVGYQSEFIRKFGDFLAPNIHPVFDRLTLSAADAAAWARSEATTLATQSRKPVVLKETGFPHAGKEPYTPESQQEFWASYLAPGIVVGSADSKSGWVYCGVAFEAFDLPWKAEASNLAIEKSWGMLSTERKPYPAFQVWREIHRR